MPELATAANAIHMKIEQRKPKNPEKDKEYKVGMVTEETEQE